MAWYNSSWLKRKPITLTGGASGAQTDYQVKLTVTYDGDMKSDFSDLRFTKVDGTTLIDSWLESKTDSTSAVIWVETDTPADTVDADIYCYYGNSAAASAWDGAATFITFDDFEGTVVDLSIWDNDISNATISTDHAYQGSKCCRTVSGGYVKCNLTPSSDIRIFYWGYHTSTVQAYPFLHGDASMASYLVVNYPGANDISYSDGSWRNTGYDITLNVWNKYEVNNFNWTSHTQDYYHDDVLIADGVGMRATDTYNSLLSIMQGAAYFDCFVIAKFCTDPATYAFGDEESTGWTGKIIGVTNPAKVMGITVDNIASVIGVS